MKKLLFLLFALTFLFRLPSAVAENLSACQPYSIVNKDSVVPCPTGYSGVQYKLISKVCPSGTISTSTEFVTASCVPVNNSGGRPPKPTIDCGSNANSGCATPANAAGCPDGQHWSLAGSNVAHCVMDDFACPWGHSLTHDRLANPSCIANTCPSNQVLQGDGISCACPSNLSAWTGSTCVVPCVQSTTPNGVVACGAGFSGTMYTSTVVSCPAGPSGSSVTAISGYNTSACGCANGGTNYPACTPPAPAGGPKLGPTLGLLPTLVHEAGVNATVQLGIHRDGTWQISLLNCGNESVPGWSNWEAWQFCKQGSISGSLLLPGSNPSDFEISRTDQINQIGVNRSNDPSCNGWQTLSALNAPCNGVEARMQITNDPRDSSDYSSAADASTQFTLNLRRKSNPGEVWSIRIIFGASFTSGTQCPYRGFCYD